jgi:hypothetical protein
MKGRRMKDEKQASRHLMIERNDFARFALRALGYRDCLAARRTGVVALATSIICDSLIAGAFGTSHPIETGAGAKFGDIVNFPDCIDG